MGLLRYFRRRRWDDERSHELDAYLEQETADNLARGMTGDEARLAAQRKLGNTTVIREEIYRMNTLGLIETLWRDIRFGVRVLAKAPAFALVALLSLALGIGAATSIFSVVYGVLISPYPYARPAEIWAPVIRDLKRPAPLFSFQRMRQYVEVKKLPAFAEAMATNPEMRLLTGERGPESFTTVTVTANAFHFLGVSPILGRTIELSDIRSDGTAEPVIVLTEKAWNRLFDGRADALGKTVTLNDQRFTVIGVMPSRFGWWTSDGGWVAIPEEARDERGVAAIFRLKPGVSAKVAEEQLHALNLQLAQQRPADFPKGGFTTSLKNYLSITVASGEMESNLRLLLGAVGFLLLIACANVANLQLARGTARAQEIAVRISIGAGRGRIFRQLLTESVLLSIVGGALGIALAFAITKATESLMPSFNVPNEARITVNQYVLVFSACISVLTGILFGLAPALRCSRPAVVDALKDSGRANSSAGAGQMRNALVIAEIALSVVLLMGASLAIRGFVKLQALDVGFRPDRVLMVNIQMPPKRYSTYEQRIAFSEHIRESVASLPGVQAVAIGNGGLPFGGPRTTYTVEGQLKDESRTMLVNLISAAYPEAMGIPLRAGRELSDSEIARHEPVALINETAARLWPAGTSPLGARIHLDNLDKPGGNNLIPANPNSVVMVVGILADTRNDGLRSPTMPAAFIPYTDVATTGRLLAVRTQTAPMSLLNAVRERVRVLDKDQPLSRPITLEEVLGTETVQPRFNMALFSFFGLLGLSMAAAGIYSMLSYTVARRTHEIGIRMALGAARGDVLSLILESGGKLALIGLSLGLAGSLALAKILRSQFDLPETDFAVLGGVVLMLAVAVLLACFVPARRAARLDPLTALRHE